MPYCGSIVTSHSLVAKLSGYLGKTIAYPHALVISVHAPSRIRAQVVMAGAAVSSNVLDNSAILNAKTYYQILVIVLTSIEYSYLEPQVKVSNDLYLL